MTQRSFRQATIGTRDFRILSKSSKRVLEPGNEVEWEKALIENELYKALQRPDNVTLARQMNFIFQYSFTQYRYCILK